MPIINKRDTANIYQGGSDLLQVYLDETDAVTAYGTGAVAGWYTIGYLEGGGVGPEFASENIRSEAGVIVITSVTSNEMIFENASLQSDDATFKLFKDFLPTKSLKYRYFLPVDPAADQYQMHALYAGRAERNNFRMSTAEGAIRTIPFVIRGGADDDGNVSEVETVDLSDELTWSADVAEFLTDDTQWPSATP